MRDDGQGLEPEELLAGCDRPRSLPLTLRSRLATALREAGEAGVAAPEGSLGAGGEGQAALAGLGIGATCEGQARSLPPQARERIEARLRRDAGEEPPVDGTTLVAPGEGSACQQVKGFPPGRRGRWPRSRWANVGVVAAVAAGVALLFGLLPGAAHEPPHAATEAAPAIARSAAGGLAAGQAFGPSDRVEPYGLPARRPLPAGHPGRTSPPVRLPSPAVLHKGKNSTSRAAVLLRARPVVAAVTPARGPSRGGNLVKVTGAGLVGVTAVYFGTVRAVKVASGGTGTVEVVAPAHSAGVVQVVVVAHGVASPLTAASRYWFT